MNQSLLEKITSYLNKQKSRSKRQKVFIGLASLVFLITVYVLMVPGITMEEVLICSVEEHVHDDSCYEEKFICDGNVSDVEDASCYEEVLSCGNEEHTHDEDCYGTDSDKAKIDYLVGLVEELPTVSEMNLKLEELSNEGATTESIEEYQDEVVAKATNAYSYYVGLDEKLQSHIINIDKVLEYKELNLIDEMEDTSIALLDDYEEYGIATVANVNALDVISAANTSEFIELNLYDYGSNLNTKYNSNKKFPGFQWNGGAYLKSTYDRHVIDYIDFGNSRITDLTYGSSSSGTNGRSTNAKIVGSSSGANGAINKLDVSSYGVTNRPIGMSLNSSITSTTEDVLSRTLGSDGYPALKDGTSLSYLFKNGTYAIKQNSANINGLFQQDSVSGEYFYNSRENHAQYSNNRFTLYKQIITPNFITYPFGNFLPLNDITNSDIATQVSQIRSGGTYNGIGDYVQHIINDMWYDSSVRNQSTGVWYDSTASQLVDMLAMYRTDLRKVTTTGGTAWTTWNAKNAIVDYFTTPGGDNPSDDTSLITDPLLSKMYNIDWSTKTNFFFGMEMKMNFMQPKGGMTGNDTNGDGASDYPMNFYFTGDDDVWVYIDDVLFLDLSGIHRHVGGEIDFVNGKVYYYYLDTENTGDVSSTPYKTYTFKEILKAAGKSTTGLNSNGTFNDYSTHSFKFYYMERGSGSSVCRLNFNFPLLRQNSISVSKKLSVDDDSEFLGNPDFKFQVLKVNSSGTKTEELFIGAGTSYTIYDEHDNVVGTGTTDANGVFSLKAGQRAEFSDIDEDSGKYYVRELLDDAIEQYGKITVSGESTTKSEDVVVGSDTFTGVDSPVKDMSDGSTIFAFDNNISLNKYGTLKIMKELEGDNTLDKEFKFQVTLDGVLLPVGTSYTITKKDGSTETKVVTDVLENDDDGAGMIFIKADETAVIGNILAGSMYEVKEINTVANDYIVKYNNKEVEGVQGEIVPKTVIEITVTNIALDEELKIPVTKKIANYTESTYRYQFQLTEVKNNLGEKLDGSTFKQIITIDVVDQQSGEFVLEYERPNYIEGETVHYYKIEEIAVEDEVTKYDENFYVIKVVVTKNNKDGSFGAKVTNVYNTFGEEITLKTNEEVVNEFVFTNHLLTNLMISKEVVNHTESSGSFTFELQVTYDENIDGEFEPIVGNYRCKKGSVSSVNQVTFAEQGITTLDGNSILASTEECTVTFVEGKTNLELSHQETIVIYGLPNQANYSLTELTTNGYVVQYQVNSGNIMLGNQATAGLNMNENQIKFMNVAGYKLPDAGGSGNLILIIMGMLFLIGPVIYIGYSFYKQRKECDLTSI